jgi:hypothetical protein
MAGTNRALYKSANDRGTYSSSSGRMLYSYAGMWTTLVTCRYLSSTPDIIWDWYNGVYRVSVVSPGTPTSGTVNIVGAFRITNNSSLYPALVTSYIEQVISDPTYGSITFDWNGGVIPKSSYKDVGFELKLLFGAPSESVVRWWLCSITIRSLNGWVSVQHQTDEGGEYPWGTRFEITSA